MKKKIKSLTNEEKVNICLNRKGNTLKDCKKCPCFVLCSPCMSNKKHKKLLEREVEIDE